MNKIKFFFTHILDIPKTIYYNFKFFGPKVGFMMPLLVSHTSKIKGKKGCFELPNGIVKPFMIRVGIDGVEGVSSQRKEFLLISGEGKIVFDGKCSLSKGICIRTSGIVKFGKNFYCNRNVTLICSKRITFGQDCLLGWDINVRDCDGHNIYQNGNIVNSSKEVIFGNNVWVGQGASTLKGVKIGDNSIIAQGSIVTKPFEDTNVIIGGYPAKIIKEGITWNI